MSNRNIKYGRDVCFDSDYFIIKLKELSKGIEYNVRLKKHPFSTRMLCRFMNKQRN